MSESGDFVVEVMPERSLELLSQHEVTRLRDTSAGGQYDIFRRCALAVLNVGVETDDVQAVLDQHRDFRISIVPEFRGLKLALHNPPAAAFVDGRMVRGIRELLFAVLRDVVFIDSEITRLGQFDLDSSEGITNAVFHILRNAGIVKLPADPNLVVCWGGHSIARDEYEYTKDTGYEFGLRLLDICTGCGPGAMKGPMKGATIGHSKQRVRDGRYIGVTEPGIIAAESPNPIVNELVIMPDIEKRLEAFVRLGHAVVVFPGGVGTVEEILFLLGVLVHPDNEGVPFPVVFTGPESSRVYFEQIDDFIRATLGEAACARYEIIIGDPAAVARHVRTAVDKVRLFRQNAHDAYFYNWRLKVDHRFQTPFEPTHDAMRKLEIRPDMRPDVLAANLRCAFSGLVAGNVRYDGIARVREHGPFQIAGDKVLMGCLDRLLESFILQRRMRLPGRDYVPCYEILA